MKNIFLGKKVLLFCLTIIVISSCSPQIRTQVINVATLIPPTKEITVDPAKFAIVASVYSDSRSASDIENNLPTDSALLVETAFFLKEALEKSPIFKSHTISVYQIKRETSEKFKHLQKSELEEISRDANITQLLSVEYIRATEFLQSGYTFDNSTGVYGYLQTLPIDYIFNLYDVANNKILDQTITKDTTIYYEEIADAGVRSLSEAVFDACVEISDNYASKIAPTIEVGERFVVLDGKTEKLSEAASLAKKDKWREAMNIWEQLAEGESNKVASISSYNMAVACEVLGNFDLAKEWLVLAGKRNSFFRSTNYEKLLEQKNELKPHMDKIKKDNNL